MTDNSGLPRSGVELVAAGFPAFQSAMQKANKLIEEIGNRAAEAAKKSMKGADATGKFEQGISKLIQRFTSGNPAIQKASSLMGDFGIQLTGATLKATIAIGVVTALIAAFVALGTRGSTLVGLGESFDRLTASVGVTSTVLLEDLTNASRGMISNFDLMRQANIALAGATGEFGRQFAEKLPDLLRLAAAQSRSTGQDINFLYQSLVTGIKRSSPLILDNLGLVISIEASNQKFAESIGKTVEQLTSEERQIALLNATLEAGRSAVEGLANAQETAAEKMARGQAIITNSLDTLAVAVQPAFGVILDVGNRFLMLFNQITVALAPIITEITNFLSGAFATAASVILGALQPIIDFISGLAPYIALALRFVNAIIQKVAEIVVAGVNFIVSFLRDVVGIDLGFDFKTLAKNFFEGAAATFGAFANAIIQTANQLIFPAVIFIARGIADFLIGLSPPPKGPLSQIDKGGSNVMAAWLEGFTGVSLQPVEQVAAEVNAMLGSIGSLSAKQVETRLAQLDAALLPFSQRLDVIKSTFEALAEPARAAIDAIDRQIATSLEALGQGDARAAAMIRNLDMQREQVQGIVSEQQRLVDNAQIQLALATAQQARERALLNIQKARVAVEKRVTEKRKKSSGGALPKEKKLTGTLPPPETPGVGTPGFTTPETSVLDDISGQSAVDDALQGLQDAFNSQINANGALSTLQDNANELGGIMAEIGGVDVGAKISARFSGIKTGIETAIEEARQAVETKVGEIGAFFTDATTPGTLPYFFQTSLPAAINNAKADIQNAIDALFSTNDSNSALSRIVTFFDGLFNPETGSISTFLAGLPATIENTRADIEEAINNLFSPDVDTSIVAQINTFFDGLFNPETGSVLQFFRDLPNNIGVAIGDIGGWIQTNIIDPVALFFTGEGPNTIGGLVQSAVDFFGGMPERIKLVLQGLGLLVFNAVVKPIESVVNSLIGLVEEAVRSIVGEMIGFFQQIAGTPLDFAGAASAALRALQEIQGGLVFDRLNIQPPPFLIPGAGTTNSSSSTVINNITNNFSSPGVQEFAIRNMAFANAGRR